VVLPQESAPAAVAAEVDETTADAEEPTLSNGDVEPLDSKVDESEA
jgi:hypothetical protein